MYHRLASAQGNLIPFYYGEADCEGDRTKVLSFFPYPTVPAISKPVSACMSVYDFTTRITTAIDEMIRYGNGVVQEDDKLNNVLVADDGRFVFVDLEAVYAPNDKVGPERTRKYAIDGLVDKYKQYIAILKEEEEEEASWRARQIPIPASVIVVRNSLNHR